MSICKKITTCILCSSYDISEVFRLNDSPPAEAYSHSYYLLDKHPLHLMRCGNCGNVQLGHALDENFLFDNYFYETASSPGLVEHFRKYAKYCVEELKLHSNSIVVDIGGNDGTLLDWFRQYNIRMPINVEASWQLSKKSKEWGIHTFNEFWTAETAERIEKLYGKVDLITANNVFAHSRHFQEQIKAVNSLLKPEGTFIMEVSYLPSLLENMVFDFIYHEHLIYHSYQSLKKCLQKIGLRIIGYERTTMKGGSIRFIISKAGSERKSSTDLSDLVQLESEMDLNSFGDRINEASKQCYKRLGELFYGGKKIVGFGASATTTTLLHHMYVGPFLCGLVDDNLNKNGMYSPGYNLPVMHPDMLPRIAPDFIFITAWRFAEQIMQKYPQYAGKFIIPLPEYKVA